ncbi:YegS/Rv2252/BmrU family lipid kinase [Agromyces mediolanus]|uniref:Diacylglycerol kinase n=1 Tax=Agromyces mediolanus TaxID=41986 RepID=A0A918FDC6_AGRME|nr:YegS/Rv2252/BmrU family lipid kinase [Agromyces mediolanus]GGR33141.1 diacylglycerol kinase [Agromyces mediolanus]GLJ74309.1 diacylglycerol kinase [Agromyces mediolanus]
MGGHIAVLANPFAGKGRGRAAAASAIAGLRAHGVEVRSYEGGSAAETAALAARALDGAPTALVVVGGDGTLSGILEPLLRASVPIVLVPAGTGNDLARALGLPRDDAAAAAALALTGTARVIDVGEVRSAGRTTPFLTVAALGFDAKVSDRTNRLRWPHGALRYYLALAIELVRLRPMDFTIRIEDEDELRAPGTLVAVGNTESYGGGMPVCVGALPDDGLLDVVHVAPLTRLRLVRLFPLLLRGRHDHRPEVTHRRAREVRVSAPGLTVYADGERVGSGACEIVSRAGALRIMVPHAQGRPSAADAAHAAGGPA